MNIPALRFTRALAAPALALALALPSLAMAATPWAEVDSNTVTLLLTPAGEDTDFVARTTTLSFDGRAYNAGTVNQPMGAYVAGAWYYAGLPEQETLLAWNDGGGYFQGGGVRLTLTRTDVPVQSTILLSDVQGSNWTSLAQGTSAVPLFDFGSLAPGEAQGVDFSFRLTMAFTPEAFDDWMFNGTVYPVFQGLAMAAPVPEPASWALMLAGLAAMGALARRLHAKAAR